MFRLAGWRLAIVVSSPLLQKSKVSQASAETTTTQPSTRRIGTVTTFKHRRGYGFLRELEMTATSRATKAASSTTEAEAAAAAVASGSDATHSFFFPRSSLDGGFFLMEGQSVAFDVRLVQPNKKLAARLGEVKGAEATSVDSAEDGLQKMLSVAHRIRLYDTATNKEKPVTPITLYGCVENWDSLAGTGVIAELDLSGTLHDDAPRFTVNLEDLDLGGRAELRSGLYVRFCLEGRDRTAARRVIIDRDAERKRAAQRITSDGTSSGAEIRSGERGCGTVRDIVEGRFGFVVLDSSGDSIFFHMSNVEGDVKPGDTVSFVLREVTQGKHAGKRTCIHVQKCAVRSGAAAGKSSGQGSKGSTGLDDDDEFELLD
ncbi:hypothetical protein DQ04_01461090 [Trypanosoma grayi]|uniref:hypothetical protein n=1 Tax=Trypanosoma grayi TaxID=71804 RepID=UPI0004F3FE2C|nr:hypothetical protein DQ04_01461090 [Trypanosoma grayi]KEG12738.1 hypothetical protein DQ04_01461090 [Trypanosoma grayi]